MSIHIVEDDNLIDVERLSMYEHVYPVLFRNNYSPQAIGNGCVIVKGNFLMVRNGDLFIDGSRELAELLLKECRPFGREIHIHLRILEGV